ncbi:unnamed protein product [Rotaria magnacalcarata]|uniref:Uncharacterized protein n=1 Tax=Rotaria magnacalcarata TaxID=392030 RepID=A0A816MHD4_9BILA|nr:unnamed protein product [Rotaria magnacalcarata]CAF1560382.1 unnamed protein product [Rotaria magnacalcarata]CAF1994183.1 unnamed protein product [Rotaria magnacalcarata]CAF2020115.1 unnamed protein product [Rotaria magnacalcarata]CAF2120162.1 unnamed protein product [Rotaria magnacalcarata]
MKTTGHYGDEFETIHPLWLGIIILFGVIIIIGISCFLRRKYGSSITRLFNRLCCKCESYHDQNPKQNEQLIMPRIYNWAPRFVPSGNTSPQLHTLVRTIQMTSVEKKLAIHQVDNNEHHNTENDSSPIVDDCDHFETSSSSSHSITQPSQEIYNHRNCEAARRLYASMRQTSQCKNSTSVESTDIAPSSLPHNPTAKTAQIHKIKTFRTPSFFQSIPYLC